MKTSMRMGVAALVAPALTLALLTACDKDGTGLAGESPTTGVEIPADPLQAVQEGISKALALPVYGTVSTKTNYEGSTQPPITGDFEFATDPKAKLTRVGGKNTLMGDFEIIMTADKLYLKGSLAKADTWSSLDLSRFPADSPFVGGFGDVYSYAGALNGLVSCEEPIGNSYQCVTDFSKWRAQAKTEGERRTIDTQIDSNPKASRQPVEVRLDDQGRLTFFRMAQEVTLGTLTASSDAEATYLFDPPPTITMPAAGDVVAADDDLYKAFGGS